MLIFSYLCKMSKRAVKFRPARAAPPAPKQPFTLISRKESVTELPSPIKSESDKKTYKVIQLQNGLRALLISDPTPRTELDDSSSDLSSSDESDATDTSSGSEASHVSTNSDRAATTTRELDEEKHAACALCVGVGSYSDPQDIQGLAHFVEHMVFMGSEKYPKENDFDSFIKKKGGLDNAQTDCEATSFHFDIPDKYLLQAMDKFSQFFVSPLMKKEAMQREREAIESEFSLATPSNSNRMDQLIASFFPEGHPARTFTWGNLHSLKELVKDDETLHRAAHAFRERHYSAHRMTVAVQARLPLNTLQQYVIDTFGQIGNNNLPPDNMTTHAYSAELVTDQFAGVYAVKPVGDISEIHITWIMPPLITKYKSKPDEYISYLLGHEGKGSLLSYLKKRVWALAIKTGNAGSGIDYTSLYSLFNAQIVLTQQGLEHIDEVLESVFSYINLLRELGPSERIFEEIRSIEEMNFRYEDESQPADYVESLAENMQLYPPEHFITGDKIYYQYDPHAILDLMNLLLPEKANIIIISNKFTTPISYDHKEPWFGTEYTRMDALTSKAKLWAEVKPYEDFHMPFENQYITTNFSLISPAPEYLEVARKLNVDLYKTSNKEIFKIGTPEEMNVILKGGDYEADIKNFRLDEPNLLRKNSLMEVWYKPDFKFRMPTALLYFYFITPLSLKSARDACLLELWTDVTRQGLREPLYPADMASLFHELYPADRGLQLRLVGFSHNLHLLADVITAEMRTSCDSLTDALFEAVREVRSRSYRNGLIKPSKLAKDIRMEMLLTPYVTLRAKADIIGNVTRQELQEFSKRLLNNMYMQVLVQGNMPWHEALKISDNVHNNVKFEPLVEPVPKIRVRQAPLGVHTCRVASFNQENTNSVIENYYQSGPTNDKDAAILEALMMLMEEPLFDRLRTKEQLGYNLFNLMRYTFGVLGYSVTVNSQEDKHSASHVDGRIEAFLKRFSRDTSRLTEKALSAAKAALAQTKHAADVELKEEAGRHWRELVSGEYRFSRRHDEAEAIEQLKLAELKEWFERHTLSGDRSNLRKISVQVVGHKSDSAEPPKQFALTYLTAQGDEPDHSENFISDLSSFYRDLPLLPSVDVKLP